MDEGEVRYRTKWRQLPWLLFVYPALQLSRAAVWPELPPLSRGLTVFAAILLAVVIAEMGWLRTMGVELRPDALVMRGIRRRAIPWRDITWIGPAPFLGTQAVGVWTQRDGMRRLRAPQHTPFIGPDKEFLAKANVIYDYWVAHRGPDWEPPRPYWASAATSAGSAP